MILVSILLLSCNSLESDKKDNLTPATEIQACNKEHDIIKVLKDEPAFIEKMCIPVRYVNDDNTLYEVRVDTFYFRLVNEHSDFFSIAGIFPCGEIPEQYRQEGLSVYISGNVTSDLVGGCSEPNIKIAALPGFEITSIKTNN